MKAEATCIQSGDLSGAIKASQVVTFETLLQSLGETADMVPDVRELQKALMEGTIEPDGCGELSAKAAAETLRIRQQTTRRANTHTSGFANVIMALEQRPVDERIMLFHFSAEDRIFTVFVTSSDEILGCVRVARERPTSK
jgi:hypothetical protein